MSCRRTSPGVRPPDGQRVGPATAFLRLTGGWSRRVGDDLRRGDRLCGRLLAAGAACPVAAGAPPSAADFSGICCNVTISKSMSMGTVAISSRSLGVWTSCSVGPMEMASMPGYCADDGAALQAGVDGGHDCFLAGLLLIDVLHEQDDWRLGVGLPAGVTAAHVDCHTGHIPHAGDHLATSSSACRPSCAAEDW